MNRQATFYSKAQAMLEYILVMVVVVVIAFLGFKNSGSSLLGRTHDKTEQYFETGSKAIMGGYYDEATKKFVRVEPSAVNGGWCAWTTCIRGYKSRECACPRPAFGGTACDGDAISSAGCPSSGGGGCVSTGCPRTNEVACGETIYDNCNNQCGRGTSCPAPNPGCIMTCKSTCIQQC